MRKAQKKQLLEILQTLKEAHKSIKKYINKHDLESARVLLGECQQSAFQIGSLIEENEGEDCPAVRRLEEYCEELYQISEGISEKITGQKAAKRMHDVFVRVENSIRDDIKERQEVVFLPYKAAMWDSLESVWRYADADPNCDAYVIPIPYYDKNPDGSFGEMHYEGDSYPKDVPVVWYGDYNFEKRRPDVIFIHNPYDYTNFVTSVHPDFYSKRLKSYTEKLVYIPYFLLEEIDPKNTEAVESIRHLCVTPAAVNADKIVVQSESMRQVYINLLTKDVGEQSRKLWEEKILGLGSPKVDKLLNTKRENLEIPPGWMKVIRKADGSWKKIIFYNTSVGALLQHNEKMLAQMRAVFEIFKENRDEVTLLWRPHPLIKATISAMRPQLWAIYEKMVEEYKSEGWGVYDDTADLHRAIVLSDAYYGDWSSIVHLCTKVGMPVMIQNVGVIERKHE